MGKEELTQFVRAAKGINMPKKELSAIVEGSQIYNPLVNLEDEMTPEFSKELTPNRIADFLAKLRGEKEGGPAGLFKMGEAINVFIGKRDETKEPTDSDMEVILLAIKLIDNSFYSGKIKLLNSQDLAALTYIVSRLAKINIFKNEGTALDMAKLNELLDKVEFFARDYLQRMGKNEKAKIAKKVFERSAISVKQFLAGGRMKAYLYLLKDYFIALDKAKTQLGGQFVPRYIIEKSEKEKVHDFRDIDGVELFSAHYNLTRESFCAFLVEYLRQKKSRKQ